MSTTTHRGRELFYEAEADDAPATVAFVGDVGFGAWLWGWQAPGLAGPYRTLVWDLPGTGRSTGPGNEDRAAPADVDPADGADPADSDSADDGHALSVDDLAAALEAVLAASDTDRAHLVGAGLGGMVALRYAREYGRARSLTLLNVAASGGAVDADALAGLAMDPDEPATCLASLAGAFSPAFRSEASDTLDRICEWRLAEDAHGAARDAQAAAMLAFEAGPPYELDLPALVCHGVDDPVVPVEAGRALAADLPRGAFEAVEGRHLAFVEHSAAVTDRIAAFLDEHATDQAAGP